MLKLRNKIIIGYLVIATLSGMICMLGINKISFIQKSYLSVSQETVPVTTALEELKFAGMAIMASANEYLFLFAEEEHRFSSRKNAGEKHNARNSVAKMDELIESGYNKLTISLYTYAHLVDTKFPEEETLLAKITQEAHNLRDTSQEVIAAKRMKLHSQKIFELRKSFTEAEDSFLVAIDAAISHERKELTGRNAQVEEAIDTTLASMLTAIALIFSISTVGGLILSRALAGPVEKLRIAAIGISEGNFDIKVDLKTRDEIGELAATFSNMATILKESQNELRMTRAYSDNIIDSMAEALIVISPSGVIERGNRTLYDLLEWSEQELLGKKIETILSDENILTKNSFRWRKDPGQNFSAETTLRNRRGEKIAIHLLGSWISDCTNNLGQMVLIAQDIRERKAAEEKLLGSRKFLETILDSMTEQISILDPHSLQIIRTNRTFCETYKVKDIEAIGKHCYQITHHQNTPCEGPNDYCPVQDVLMSRSVVCCEHIHRAVNGEEEYYEIQVAPIFDNDDNINQVIHTARNITERKRAEQALLNFTEQLESKNKQLENKTEELTQAHHDLQESQSRILQQDKMASIGQLAAGVAHEINNPMGFIISNLNTLDKYIKKLVEFEEFQASQMSEKVTEIVATERKRLKIDYLLEDAPDLLNESLDGADRVKKIVLDLKGFSRVDQAEFASISLNDCLDSTINIIWNEIKYNAKLERDYRLESPVSCFPQQLTQVFINLLVNASHAIEEQGIIKVSTCQENEHALITLSDTGKGIPEDIRQKIFEPFFTTKAVGKGTGLGLSIVYDIIKKHRGTISVESTPGEGTTFSIRMPLEQEEPTPETAEEPGPVV